MGRSDDSTISYEPPKITLYAEVYQKEEFKLHEALPGFHWINRLIEHVKAPLYDASETGCKKAGAYLGFRILSYSGVPLALNLISLILSVVLVILSLPLALCDDRPLRWSWEHMDGSLNHTVSSIYDLTCDLRQLTGLPCCDPESIYLLI